MPVCVVWHDVSYVPCFMLQRSLYNYFKGNCVWHYLKANGFKSTIAPPWIHQKLCYALEMAECFALGLKVTSSTLYLSNIWNQTVVNNEYKTKKVAMCVMWHDVSFITKYTSAIDSFCDYDPDFYILYIKYSSKDKYPSILTSSSDKSYRWIVVQWW